MQLLWLFYSGFLVYLGMIVEKKMSLESVFSFFP